MTFPEALAYVLSLQAKGWRMGLDRIQELIQRIDDLRLTIDNPNGRSSEDQSKIQKPKSRIAPGSAIRNPKTERSPAFLHVAGTNGKGSVTRYLHSILHEAGHRVGGYYSPYVYEPRERIQFGNDLISEEDYARVVSELAPIAEAMATPEFGGGVSKFEFETAMGLMYWKQMGCEYVALEVGMGGRLDATNIVHPAACAIVSIGLDHTQYLGDTFDAIAREKAGIIKPGVPVVVGEMPPEALEAIEQVASSQVAHVWRMGREVLVKQASTGEWKVATPFRCVEGLVPGIPGSKQPENAAIAIAMLDAAKIKASETAIRQGIAKATLPGRFEMRTVGGVQVVLDGAHNPDAADVLAETLEERFPGQQVVLLTGMLEGHDPVAFYERLLGYVSAAHVSPIDFHRALPTWAVERAIKKPEIPSKAHGTVAEALEAALDAAKSQNAPLLVTGSFYLLGEVGPLLDGLAEPSGKR